MDVIPHTVKPRKDTGLYNAKLGIWLFLASEVMLFGGLFSAYVFLRLGAPDGTWPHKMLEVLPGLFNTAILILSSVTVVMAWASVKLKQFNMFRIYMGITLLSSLIFVGVKAYEYSGKFAHTGIFLKENRVEITGHVKKETDEAVYLAPDGKQPWHLYEKADEKYGELYTEEQLANYDFPGVKRTDKEVHPHPSKVTDHLLNMMGAYKLPEHAQHVLKIDKSAIFRMSNFTPAYNTYFAIYFTMTGLHALHVIGGAIVLFYFWLPGSGLYFKDRQHFANRIEVGGLFWHFVDLVWIFLFPLMYLL